MRKLALILFYSFLTCTSLLNAQTDKSNKDLDKILGKKAIRIVVTDSGIGGLAVMSDIAARLRESGSFKQVELIFVNALFDPESGYNAMPLREDKINMFNKVLYGIDKKYDPDLIFVACNTLSVLIDATDFNIQKGNPPVIGIVDPGVRLIHDRLRQNPNSSVLIFGTETTIEEGTHKEALLAMGYNENRIINKACPQLQSFIEQNPSGEETELLITFYMSEALEEVADLSQVVDLSLNCSHFGYSYPLWVKAMDNYLLNPGQILNPNNSMGDVLITEKNTERYRDPEILFTIVSKVRLVNAEAMIEIFESSSPAMAEALRNYQLVKDLF